MQELGLLCGPKINWDSENWERKLSMVLGNTSASLLQAGNETGLFVTKRKVQIDFCSRFYATLSRAICHTGHSRTMHLPRGLTVCQSLCVCVWRMSNCISIVERTFVSAVTSGIWLESASCLVLETEWDTTLAPNINKSQQWEQKPVHHDVNVCA